MNVQKSQQEIAPPLPDRSGRVHLRTLTLIRWIGIGGQLSAILMAHFALRYALPFTAIFLTISASALLNLWAVQRQRRGPTIADRAAAGYLAFDIAQLAVLLYLTGGLANPFAMLLLAPLTVGAAILRQQWVVALTCTMMLAASILALSPYPLPWPSGDLPGIFRFGVWSALVLSALFIAAYIYSVAAAAQRISTALHETQLALGRTQRMAAVGALAAAAAHELGTPLSTIAVVAKELAHDLPAGTSQAEDAALLLSQVERCRKILAELAQRPDRTGAEISAFEYLDLQTLLTMVAAPYRRTDVRMDFVPEPGNTGNEPVLLPQPELLHGLANIVQNATQYAVGKVTCRLAWRPDMLTVRIEDDGPGFSATVLERLGEPYISTRTDRDGHLGLGIFIAMNLLAKTGATLTYVNLSQGGAAAIVTWRGAHIFGITRKL